MNDILFRVDASNINIGTGHLYRCLNLANELKELSYSVAFVLRALPGNYGDLVKSRGFDLIELAFENVDEYRTAEKHESWLGVSWKLDAKQTINVVNLTNAKCVIVDHYSLDYRWHKLILETGVKLVSIDDLANRILDCDLLIDQSYQRTFSDYSKYIKTKENFFLGPRFAILGSDFYLNRGKAVFRRTSSCRAINNIFLSFGGVDPNNYTSFVLKILRNYERNLNIQIVVGKGFNNLTTLQSLCNGSKHNIKIFQDIDSLTIANKMLEADLAFGSSGTTTWERCCLELPTIFIVNNSNKDRIKDFVKDTKNNYIIEISESNYSISEFIFQILDTGNREISKNLACDKIDGLGGRRVAAKIHQLLDNTGMNMFTRQVRYRDKDLIYRWQSDSSIRKYFNNPKSPTYEEHIEWMKVRLDSSDTTELIFWNNQPVGVIRVDFMQIVDDYRRMYEVSIYIDPRNQGTGIASAVLNYVLYVFKYELLYASINKDNLSSIKLFKRQGFRQISNRGYLYDYSNNN
jgi:UDP-2,4-diacetamido-2,4,6-trideoxy-beta-L-altropyranose hydrolase